MEREPTLLEQTALRWVVRSDRGLSGEQERELVVWLDADARHRELFAEFGGTWTLLARAHRGALEPTMESGARAENTIAFEAPRTAGTAQRGVRAWWLPLAAAAAVAIGATTWWRVTALRPMKVATDVGVSRQLTLSDGSTVALNTDSTVVTAFASGERRVRLQKGEAFFQVAKDAARPFVVEAAGVGVRAIGTAFNVRVHPASIEVLVTEGRVRVVPAGKRGVGDFAEVSAGQSVVVPVGTPAAMPQQPVPVTVSQVPLDEVQRRLAWQEKRLDFSDTPLGEMVAEFNRYHRHKLVVPEPELAGMRFGGSFRPGDREGFVRLLREHFGIMAEERAGETILRGATR